jgi:hypothetical protein
MQPHLGFSAETRRIRARTSGSRLGQPRLRCGLVHVLATTRRCHRMRVSGWPKNARHLPRESTLLAAARKARVRGAELRARHVAAEARPAYDETGPSPDPLQKRVGRVGHITRIGTEIRRRGRASAHSPQGLSLLTLRDHRRSRARVALCQKVAERLNVAPHRANERDPSTLATNLRFPEARTHPTSKIGVVYRPVRTVETPAFGHHPTVPSRKPSADARPEGAEGPRWRAFEAVPP